MRLFDLSIRYKIPLWGGLLILMTAFSVSAMLMYDAWEELEEDMLITSESISRALMPGLAQALREDDVWQAYQALIVPVHDATASGPAQAESLLLVDRDLKVFAASRPVSAPVQTDLAAIGADYAQLAARLDEPGADRTRLVTVADLRQRFYVTPVLLGEARIGTLILTVPSASLLPRFRSLALHGLLGAMMVMCVLMPMNWFWAQYMTRPLVQLTDAMAQLGQRLRPVPRVVAPYMYRDELGRLFHVYNQMVEEVRARELMERQVVQSERLAAVGQLAAGIAHEINNPLGGMLTAIDTLRVHAPPDPMTERTVMLLERGLQQIRETVGALLVQAKVRGADLTARDIEDVRMLIAPQVHDKGLRIEWLNRLQGTVPLPATMIRQVLINLLLNAVQAAGRQGEVSCEACCLGRQLRLDVRNDGRMLTDEQAAHLFEPFTPSGSGGQGLGLWVTYQIVRQLGGQIRADRVADQTRFVVQIPLPEAQ